MTAKCTRHFRNIRKYMENIYILSFLYYHSPSCKGGLRKFEFDIQTKVKGSRKEKKNHKYLFISKDQEQGIPQLLFC